MKEVTRREYADSMLLRAINAMAEDPNGQVTLLRVIALATIANAMLQQEVLDSTIEMELGDEDDGPEERPW